MERRYGGSYCKCGYGCIIITITVFLFVGLSVFRTPASAADKIHLDNVPYVVQKERLD